MKRLRVVPLGVWYSYEYSKDCDSTISTSVIYLALKEEAKDALTIGTAHETEKAKELRKEIEDSLKMDMGMNRKSFWNLHINEVKKEDLEYRACQIFRKVA